MGAYRNCNVCAREFERTPEFWPRHPKGHEGLHGTCKECIARISSERYAKTRDAYLERQKQYRKRSRVPGSRRDEYLSDRDRRIAYSREYRLRNPGRAARTSREYRTDHPDKVAKSKKASNAKRRGAPGKFTIQDITAKYEAQKGICFYCQRELGTHGFHTDHYIPISRGGSNDSSNIVLACARCNLTKHDKLPAEFKPSKE